jgi:lipoprotein Spr
MAVLMAILSPLCTTAQPVHIAPNATESAKYDVQTKNYNIHLMSKKLGIPFDSAYDTEILLLSCEWINVPYAYGSCSKNGTDCSGFAQQLYKTIYQKEMVHSAAGMFTQCDPIKRTGLQHGDLLFFKIYKNRISHVGVYLGSGYFIHASTQRGVIVSHLDEPYYKRTYFIGGRAKDLSKIPN